MGSQTAFGPRGSATLLSKATTISAVLFMVTSLSLSILATRNAGLGATVLDTSPQKVAPVSSKAPVSLPAPGTAPGQPAPGQMMQVPVSAQPTGNPGEVKIDMKDFKPPVQAPPPAEKK